MSSFENLSTVSVIRTITEDSVESDISRVKNDSSSFPSTSCNIKDPAMVVFIRRIITDLTSVAILRSFISGSDAECVFAAIIAIQSLARGYLARKRTRRLFSIVEFDSESRSRQYHAVVIQRYTRGFLSRRNCDSLRRKKTITFFASRNQEARRHLMHLVQVNRESHKSSKEERSRERLIARAHLKHHLLSTEVSAGVFNPRIGGPIETKWGSPMETIIKDCYRVVNMRK
jgi:hypothetical protein